MYVPKEEDVKRTPTRSFGEVVSQTRTGGAKWARVEVPALRRYLPRASRQAAVKQLEKSIAPFGVVIPSESSKTEKGVGQEQSREPSCSALFPKSDAQRAPNSRSER